MLNKNAQLSTFALSSQTRNMQGSTRLNATIPMGSNNPRLDSSACPKLQ
jgi:hypothetical protein